MLSILKICSGLWLQNSNYSLFPSGSLCRGILVHFAAEQVDLFTAESMDPFARILQIKAVARKIACYFYRVMTKGDAFVERGIELYQEQLMEQKRKYLQRQAHNLNLQLVPISF